MRRCITHIHYFMDFMDNLIYCIIPHFMNVVPCPNQVWRVRFPKKLCLLNNWNLLLPDERIFSHFCKTAYRECCALYFPCWSIIMVSYATIQKYGVYKRFFSYYFYWEILLQFKICFITVMNYILYLIHSVRWWI